MSDIFEGNETKVAKFEDLVGEGKKFSDPDALAKAKGESDAFIQKLQGEMDELRTELKSRLSVEELLERMPKAPQPQAGNNDDNQNRQEPGPAEKPEVDISKVVADAIAAEKSRESTEKNISDVRAGLKERFGADYNQRLVAISEELGVGVKFLQETAAKSPLGFFKLVDSVAKPDDNRPTTPPRNNVNAAAAPASGVRKNKAYYKELRQKDPTLYFTPKIQNEMHTEAMRQGADFYK